MTTETSLVFSVHVKTDESRSRKIEELIATLRVALETICVDNLEVLLDGDEHTVTVRLEENVLSR